ncbi:MAG: hypothetical protein E7220_05335 [Clostridiales bacterium]|nr:hypothetical protein [Clostridiales bacterium]
MPYLLANGARRVELGMATHLHTDHYLGLIQLAAEYPVGAIGIPSDYRRSIESIEKRQSAGNTGRSAAQGNGQDSGRSARQGNGQDSGRSAAQGNGQDSGRRAGQGSGSDRNSLGNGDVAGRGNSEGGVKSGERWKTEGGTKSGERWKTEGGMDSFALPEKIEYMETGSRICISDDVYIEPIWPLRTSGGGIDIDDPNEHNMVYLVSYKGVKIMVTGDLLEEDELEMVSYYRGTDVLDCDVLKVAHHGSKSSSSEAFLDAVSPEIAVIQVGKNNLYGHPHQQTLERLEERGIKVYRTDQNGAVGVDIHGDEICIDTNI